MKFFQTLLKIAKPTATILPHHRSTLPITVADSNSKKNLDKF